MPQSKFGKIGCIILFILLLTSSLNFILNPPPVESEEPEPKEHYSTSIPKEAKTDSSVGLYTSREGHTIHYQNEIEILNSPLPTQERKTTGAYSRSRGDGKLDYDLNVTKVTINYTGLLWWHTIDDGRIYTFFIAGELGEPTSISVTIKNIGKLLVENKQEAALTINLTDYFGHSSWERREYLGHLLPDAELTFDFTWVPTYSNIFNLTCTLNFPDDQDQSNNILRVFNLFTKKWSDDFQDGQIDDWAGDIGSDKWHITSTVEKNPNPDVHTSPYVLYHGQENVGNSDDYGEKNNFDIISPEIDLKNLVTRTV
jgi:hypothetical protein